MQTLVLDFSLGWLMRFVFCLSSISGGIMRFVSFSPLGWEDMIYVVSCISSGSREVIRYVSYLYLIHLDREACETCLMSLLIPLDWEGL